MISRISVALFVLMMCISSAAAEERLGVAVYPGAKYDPIRTRLITSSPTMQGAAYRTDDDIDKVTAYYRKQGLLYLKIGSPSAGSARFKSMDSDTDVVVQSPWRDAQTGATMRDTLILIIEEKEQKAE
jgi:hypothetical protein